MQLLTILSELNDKELASLEEFVIDSGRVGVPELLRELKRYRSGKRKFNKENLYRSATGKPYTPENEDDWKYWVRSLKDLVYQFLAEAEFRHVMRQEDGLQEQWAMRALFRRRIDQVFEQEVDRLIKQGKKKFPLRHQLELYNLKDLYHQNFKPQDARLSYERHLELICEIDELELLRLARTIRKNEVGKAALMRRRDMLTSTLLSSANTFHLDRTEVVDLRDHEDKLCAYYRYNTDAQLLRGVERIEALKRAYALMPDLKSELEFGTNAALAMLHNIVSGYYIMGMYEEALEHTLEAWKVMDRKVVERFSSIYESRIRILLALKRYQEVIDFYKEEGHHLTEQGSKIRADVFVSYSYLFLHNTTAAIKQMVKYGVMSNAVEVHLRFMYVIVAIIEDDLVTTQRNLLNYKNSVNMEGKPDLQFTYDCFDRFVRIWNKGGEDKQKKLKKLYTDIKKSIRPSLANMLPLVWLQEYLAEDLKLQK